MLRIRNLKIEPALILAPMSGISDVPFRKIMRKFGVHLAFMEMLNVRALPCARQKIDSLFKLESSDWPVGIQLLGTEEKFILRALEILHKYKLSIIDFNAACPVRKVVRRGEGAALLREPKKLYRLLKLIRKNTDLALSVKLRTGWSKSCVNAVDIASYVQDAGLDCIFIHGRTREQKYSGNVDYETIKRVKKSVSIPVVASGDIFSAALAKKMLDETAADGLLLARGTLGHPWLFKEIKTYLESGVVPKLPSLAQKFKVIFQHLDFLIDFYGEKTALIKFRKFIGWYLKGEKNIRAIRKQSSQIKTKKELSNLLNKFRLIKKELK
ncbi:MAG: tRNA dihydrouridine synthase DusB [Candidatus Omnitrophica bacterium]|nr:tRNA dihydrouridine synthase DusB [Candidatus Omnitrophota bacterium]